jgi:protein-L-isoaspartate(D-aspartate) O-methyltransferase
MPFPQASQGTAITMDFQAARLAMVESQIRPNGVRDTRVLNAFATLPRELFVPQAQKTLAYMDEAALAAPASGETPARHLLPPMTLARMLQSASLSPADHALDLGGATGYSAAVLAGLCRKVDALESSETLAELTRSNLKAANIEGVAVHSGALEKGLDAAKPFDFILVNGAVADEPKELFAQLAEGGRLAVILRRGWYGQAYLFSKSAGAVSGRPIFDAGADYLPGFEPAAKFVF